MAIVGREPFADVVLPFPQVSTRHAYLEPVGPELFQIVDLSSTNGTFVGGRRVTVGQVRRGDDVRFGTVPFDWALHGRVLDAEAALPRGLTLGRDPSCDVTVADPRVSGRHLRVLQQGPQYLVLDAGSANGFSLNGRSVSRAVVSRGDRVSLGSLEIDFFGVVERRRAAAATPARPVIASVPVPPVVPAPLAPAPVEQEAERRAEMPGWAWGLVAVTVLALTAAGIVFATREDVVTNCRVGPHPVSLERVFLWQADEARARAARYTYCPTHGDQPVGYTRTALCQVCGRTVGVQRLLAPRRDEKRDETITQGVHPECQNEKLLRDAGGAVMDKLDKAAGVVGDILKVLP